MSTGQNHSVWGMLPFHTNPLNTRFHSLPCSGNARLFRICANALSSCLPLFVYPAGSTPRPFTYSNFLQLLRERLTAIGLPSSLYSGHSFRRGGASFAFALHLPRELIQQQENWCSDTYLRYLDKPLTQWLKVAFAFRKALTKHGTLIAL